MLHPRLMAVITALIVLAPPVAKAQYSIDQLREIEGLILSRDCGALRNYLWANPQVMDGTDPLAVELRGFARDVDAGVIACVGAVPPPGADPGLTDTFAGSY
jgi:hypothetical protein